MQILLSAPDLNQVRFLALRCEKFGHLYARRTCLTVALVSSIFCTVTPMTHHSKRTAQVKIKSSSIKKHASSPCIFFPTDLCFSLLTAKKCVLCA